MIANRTAGQLDAIADDVVLIGEQNQDLDLVQTTPPRCGVLIVRIQDEVLCWPKCHHASSTRGVIHIVKCYMPRRCSTRAFGADRDSGADQRARAGSTVREPALVDDA
jgi:hypothetical protein